MNIWVYFFDGLVAGVFMGMIIGSTILKKHRFEPGTVVDFYLLRLGVPQHLFVALWITLASQMLLPGAAPLFIYVLAGIYAGMHVFYIIYTVLMGRAALLSKGYYVANGILVYSAHTQNTSARIIALLLAASLCVYTAVYYQKYYSVRYKHWSEGMLRKLYLGYEADLMEYDLDEQAIMLCFMMVENTARPPAVRILERSYARYGSKKVFSTGIMQVKAQNILSDRESAKRGFKILHDLMQGIERLNDTDKLSYLAYEYNGDHNYALFLGYFYEYSRLEVARHQVSAKM